MSTAIDTGNGNDDLRIEENKGTNGAIILSCCYWAKIFLAETS